MEINLFEIIAQIINFFILLFILQKLFYKPITKVMDERQERIYKAKKLIEDKLNESEKLIIDYQDKIETINREKKAILDSAKTGALEEKGALLKKYQKEIDLKRLDYIKEILEEKNEFLKQVSIELGENALKIAGKILEELLSKNLEEEIFESFLINLKKLEIKDKEITYISISSFKSFSEKEILKLETTLKDLFENLNNINYQVKESLVLGYELHLKDYTFHHNISKYLYEIKIDILEDLEIQNK